MAIRGKARPEQINTNINNGPAPATKQAKAKAPGPDTMDFPNSSNVMSASYYADKEMLTITFKSGTYSYDDISPEMWQSLRMSPSAGTWVNSYLVGPDKKNPYYTGVKLG